MQYSDFQIETDYGVDSLMAVELVNWIKKEIGINVSQLDILGKLFHGMVFDYLFGYKV